MTTPAMLARPVGNTDFMKVSFGQKTALAALLGNFTQAWTAHGVSAENQTFASSASTAAAGWTGAKNTSGVNVSGADSPTVTLVSVTQADAGTDHQQPSVLSVEMAAGMSLDRNKT